MALSASKLNPGDTRTEVVLENLSRTRIVMYAGASGDYNPLHSDEVYVTKVAGYPTVFAHGMLSMGATGKLLTDWVGNGSGFYGDRLAAMREMLEAPEHQTLDVLTGDYLAELTMLILYRSRAKDPAAGYARTFVSQLKASLDLVASTGVKVVCTTKTTAPRTFSSIWGRISPSENSPTLAMPSSMPSTSQISSASSGFALPVNTLNRSGSKVLTVFGATRTCLAVAIVELRCAASVAATTGGGTAHG